MVKGMRSRAQDAREYVVQSESVGAIPEAAIAAGKGRQKPHDSKGEAAMRVILHRALRVTVTALGMLGCASHFSAQATETSLSMNSDPGDYIGIGQQQHYTGADGTFTASRNYAGGVSVAFHSANWDHWWYLDFAAAGGQPLTPGLYTGAVRYPFQAFNQPGLSVYGDGRGCNTLTGTFNVREVSFNALDEVASFDASFEQHCEGAAPALRGEIRFNANVVLSLTAPAYLAVFPEQGVNFNVSASDEQSRHVVLTASDLPAGASFTDHGDNTGTFTWTPNAGQLGNYQIAFRGDNQQGDATVTYTHVQVKTPPPLNDDFNDATPVSTIPFAVTQEATDATVAADDPYGCYTRNQTLWFAYTPESDGRIEANTVGSNYDTTLSVFTGNRGALNPLGCNDDAGGTLSSRIRFDAVAGTTYYFMVSSLYPTPNANLTFNVSEAPPPWTFVPTINQFATLQPTTGSVTIQGTVTCNRAAYVYLSGQLKQIHGGVPISGYFSDYVPCEGVTPWRAVIQPPAALFRGRSAALFVGGKATVTGEAQAFDLETGEFRQINLSTEVVVRGGKRR